MKPSYMRLLTPYLRNMSSADIVSYCSYVSGVLSKSRLAKSHGIIVKRSASVSVLHTAAAAVPRLPKPRQHARYVAYHLVGPGQPRRRAGHETQLG